MFQFALHPRHQVGVGMLKHMGLSAEKHTQPWK